MAWVGLGWEELGGMAWVGMGSDGSGRHGMGRSGMVKVGAGWYRSGRHGMGRNSMGRNGILCFSSPTLHCYKLQLTTKHKKKQTTHTHLSGLLPGCQISQILRTRLVNAWSATLTLDRRSGLTRFSCKIKLTNTYII